MIWYRFWKKTTRGHINIQEKYEFYERSNPSYKTLKQECELWAESIPGGHNDGYEYGFEEVNLPPRGELERMIKECKCKKKNCETKLELLRKELKRN